MNELFKFTCSIDWEFFKTIPCSSDVKWIVEMEETDRLVTFVFIYRPRAIPLWLTEYLICSHILVTDCWGERRDWKGHLIAWKVRFPDFNAVVDFLFFFCGRVASFRNWRALRGEANMNHRKMARLRPAAFQLVMVSVFSSSSWGEGDAGDSPLWRFFFFFLNLK